MQFSLNERNGKYIIEGCENTPFLRNVTDVSKIIEACFNHRTKRLLLYSENLTDRFFDLSSLEAGEILQKLRNYNIRLAVVLDHKEKKLSSAFQDLIKEESRNNYFRLFEDRENAKAWLVEND